MQYLLLYTRPVCKHKEGPWLKHPAYPSQWWRAPRHCRRLLAPRSIGTAGAAYVSDVGPHTLLEHVQPSTLQVKGPPTPAHRARLYWTTGEIGLVPAFPPQAIVWDKAAALLTFSS